MDKVMDSGSIDAGSIPARDAKYLSKRDFYNKSPFLLLNGLHF